MPDFTTDPNMQTPRSVEFKTGELIAMRAAVKHIEEAYARSGSPPMAFLESAARSLDALLFPGAGDGS